MMGNRKARKLERIPKLTAGAATVGPQPPALWKFFFSSDLQTSISGAGSEGIGSIPAWPKITVKGGSDQSDPAARLPRGVAEWEAGVSAVLFLAGWTVTGVVTRKTVAWTAFLNLNIHLKKFFFMPIRAGTDCRKSGVFGSNHLLCYSLGTLESLSIHSFLTWLKSGFLISLALVSNWLLW